jgi:hypothetical protein
MKLSSLIMLFLLACFACTMQEPDLDQQFLSSAVGTWQLIRREERRQSDDPCLQGAPYDVLIVDTTANTKLSFFRNCTMQYLSCSSLGDSCNLAIGRFECRDSLIHDTILRQDSITPEVFRHGIFDNSHFYRFHSFDTLVVSDSGMGRWGCPSFTFKTYLFYCRTSYVPTNFHNIP